MRAKSAVDKLVVNNCILESIFCPWMSYKTINGFDIRSIRGRVKVQSSDSLFQEWYGLPKASFVERLRRLANDLENVEQCSEAQAPGAAMNSWTLGSRSVPCLIGRPLGHPAIFDGKPACSSELFYFDPERGIARTMSRWYRLGTRVDPDYWTERLAGRS
jgi:hypothetical protein